MSRCQRRGTAVRPSLRYEDYASTCNSYTKNEDSPWKLPPESVVRMRASRPVATDNNLKSRLARLEERVARLESSKENLTGTSVEIKSFYTDPDDPSSVIGFVSRAGRRFRFTEPISLPEAASFPNVDLKETKVMKAPTSLDAEPVVTPPEAPPLRSPGDLGISPPTRRRMGLRRVSERSPRAAGMSIGEALRGRSVERIEDEEDDEWEISPRRSVRR